MADEKKIYGVHRCEKRHIQSIYGIENENNRDDKTRKIFDNSDIDYDRTNQNFFYKKSNNWLEDIKSRIGNIKYKNDAVMMLDAIYTGSPEWFCNKTQDEIKDYFDDCLEWHKKTYCHDDDTLVINAVIHYDETTPHLHVISVPITEDNRLCAKDIMGNRKDYSSRQDSFYEDVTKDRGMERGEVHEISNRRKRRDAQEKKIKDLEDEIVVKNNIIQDQQRTILDQQRTIADQDKEIEDLKNEKEDLKNEKEKLKKDNEDQIAKNKRTFEAAQKLESEKIALESSVDALKASEEAFQNKMHKRVQKSVNEGNKIANSEVKGQGEADTRYGNP